MPHRRRQHASTNTPDNTGEGSSFRSVGTPNLLRRKVPVEDDKREARRLVEYFVVISSHPRWNATEARSSPRPKRKSTPPALPRKIAKEIPKLSSKWFIGRRASRSQSFDSQKTEEREEVSEESPRQPSPERDDPRGNIRVPQTTDSEYTFQPMITERFPTTDYPDHPLNPMLVQFCYPHSDVILPSTQYVMPRIHHFVLTTDKGGKVYGTCLTVHEEYYPSNDDPYHLRRNETVHSDRGENDIEVTVEHDAKKVLYIPRVLCVLSTWPYLTAFREYLTQLYRLATTTNLMDTPIERHILNLCMEIPAPPPGAFEIQVPIMTSTIRFWAPPAKLPIPYVALPYRTLFDCLDVDNVLKVWYSLLLERSVLLVSSQYSILTVCAELLCSLLFPMRWSHLYIPLVPRFLSPMLEAPFPYLCGVIRENWIHARDFVSEGTMIVDLDTNTVTYSARSPTLPPVPTKKWEKLRTTLQQCAGEMFWETRGLVFARRQVEKEKMSESEFNDLWKRQGDPRWKEKLNGFDFAFNLAYTPDSPNLLTDVSEEKQQSQSDKVQEAFLRFLVSTLKGYRRFLCIPEGDSPDSSRGGYKRWSHQRSFDRDGFMATQKLEYRPFMKEFLMTQQFDDYITKRLYSPGEPDVKFFDQNIDAKLNRSRLKIKKLDTPFLQSAQAHKTLNVVTAVAPNAEGLPPPPEGWPEEKRVYMYKTWPDKFDPRLFGTPRPIPKIITAEFDRQSDLVARLRAYHPDADHEGGKTMMNFYGGDFDPSPEVATFTVFFFTYSAVIGREWQEYRKKRDEMEPVSPAPAEDIEIEIRQDGTEIESPREVTERAIVEEEEAGSLIGAILDCSSSDCDPCPQNGSNAQMFQDTFLAQFSGSQVMLSRSTTPSKPQMSLLDFDDALAEYEETREVTAAQLDLAFSVLATMNLRDLPTDPDAFKSLMEACGRCGDTDRALQLMETMKKEGFVTDGELYSSLMQAFAQGDGSCLPSPTHSRESDLKASGHSHLDAYTSFLKKKLHCANRPVDTSSRAGTLSSSEHDDSDVFSALSSESESDQNGTSFLSDFLYTTLWGSPKSDRRKVQNSLSKRRRRRRSSFSSLTTSRIEPKAVTDCVQMQNVLGESLLEFLYPGLRIDANSDSCPQCSKQLTDYDIVQGWVPCQFEDFTTACPQCKHRFVPRFSVKCAAPTFEGSQGKSTPLYCELLSPWVLRKELENIVHGSDGIEGMLNPEWRSGTDIRATLWWNLIVSFNRYRLPVSFLLQGSFQNRLINPTPDA